ncbi:MAG: BON domain-containing protein [Legionellaceae bacterium]|nr:BON domain-containing protein [Legionellaceae bacterium]
MKLKIGTLVLLLSLVSGCVVGLVAAATGLVVYDRRSVVMIERDARIFHLVHTEIVTNPQFDESHIGVTSFNQVVLLTGQTPKASLRELAEKVAKKTPKVRRVYNEITIDEPISFADRSKDTWITGEVRTKLLRKKDLESGSIRVVTENAVVYLMGIATPEQANLAVDVARQIKGVRKVVKVFQYVH